MARFSLSARIGAFAMAAIALTLETAQAEVVEFTTFTEAFNSLLDVDNALVSGGFDSSRSFIAGGGQNTNCDARFLAGGEEGLSEVLGFLCFDGSNNGTAGTALSGGIFSFQPTRTVSQFAARRGRAPSAVDSPATDGATSVGGSATGQFTTASFVGEQFFGDSSELAGAASFGEAMLGVLSFDGEGAGDGLLRWTEDRWSVLIRVDLAYQETPGTIYAPESSSFSAQTSLALAFQITEEFVGGFSAYFSYEDATTDRNGIAPTQFTGEISDNYYEDVCGVPAEGGSDSRGFGLGAFGAWRGSEGRIAPFLAGEATLSVSDTSYQRSLCYSSDASLDNFEEHAGVIYGDALQYQAFVDLSAGFDFEFRGVTFGPRAGGDIRFAFTPAYEETEVQSTTTEYASGGALAFDEHHTVRVRGRIGLAAATEFDVAGQSVSPYFEGAFIYEVVQDDTRVTARFAGDGRATPLYFSFLTGDPDPSYFILATGFAVALDGGGRIVVNGETTLGDDDLDAAYGVSADLVLPFN